MQQQTDLYGYVCLLLFVLPGNRALFMLVFDITIWLLVYRKPAPIIPYGIPDEYQS